MKKWMFAALVAILAFAMVGCDNGGGTTPPPEGPKVTVTFIPWAGEDPVATVTIAEGATFADAGEALPATPTRPGEFAFNRWEDAAGDGFTVDIEVWADMTVTGAWWSTTLTIGTDADEKLLLENGSFAIYEFDVTGKNIDTITGVEVKYKLSEAELHKGVRNVRLMGPYIYNDVITNIDGTGATGRVAHFGDFAYDTNGAPTARYIASATAADYARDKNGPYINHTFNADWKGSTLDVWPTATIAGNEWFTITYPFNKGNFDGDLGTGNGWTVAKVQGIGNNKVATDATNKIYFGIGIPSQNANDGGILQLVKDVTLKTSGGDVDGVIPDLSLTVGGKKSSNGDQVFASFFDPIQYNWRGEPTATATRPTAPAAADEFTINVNAVDLGAYDAETGEGYFYANLADIVVNAGTTGTYTGGLTDVVTGSVAGTFTGDDGRLSIGFLPAHAAQLQKAETVEVTVTGTSTADTVNFRFYLANPFAGADWNGTNATNGNSATALSNLLGTALPIDWNSGNKQRPGRLTYLLLRSGGAGNITITSIKVEYTIVPETPAIPATEDFVFYKSTAAGGTGAVVKSEKPTANWGKLAEFNALSPIEFPKQDGEQLTIRSYEKFSIVVKFYGADGTTELFPDVAGSAETGQYGKRQWVQVNFGGVTHNAVGIDMEAGAFVDDGTVNVPTSLAKYDGIKDNDTITLDFERRSDTTPAELGWIELMSIIFYAPEP